MITDFKSTKDFWINLVSRKNLEFVSLFRHELQNALFPVRI